MMAANSAEPVRVCGIELRFADGTPVTVEMFENEPSEKAMDRAEEINDDELDVEIRIIDELRATRILVTTRRAAPSYPCPTSRI